MKNRIYISGKIGHPITPTVRQKFNHAAQQLAAAGFDPVNPFDNGLPDDAPWLTHILADLDILRSCSGIYLLTDWDSSNGAKIEEWVARQLFSAEMIFKQTQHMAFIDFENAQQ